MFKAPLPGEIRAAIENTDPGVWAKALYKNFGAGGTAEGFLGTPHVPPHGVGSGNNTFGG